MTAMVITNDGITAINNASNSGPRVDIDTFKLGADANFTPLATDTDIHGTQRYSGSVTNYRVVDADVVEFELIIDQTEGDYSYGNVGLFLSSGDLFALAAYPTLRNKVGQNLASGELGDRHVIIAQVTMDDPSFTLSFQNYSDPPRNIWASDARTSSFVDSTTFTVSGDVTTEFAPDIALKISLGASLVYAFVETSTYAGGPDETTIVVSESVLTGALTSVDYSVISPGDESGVPRTQRSYIAIEDDGFTARSSIPSFYLEDTDAAVDEGLTGIRSISGQFSIVSYSDDRASNNVIIEVSRTAHVVDGVAFPSGNVSIGTSAITTSKLYVSGNVTSTTQFQVGSNVVWHQGNDGAGSGLDADLLDGIHASGFATSVHSHSLATTSNPGFMSASDKTKLNNIADGATGDLTAAQILAKLITVDGAGSGLDADTLDGNTSSAFASSTHNHDASVITSGTLDRARLPNANVNDKGAVELATPAETSIGTASDKALTPSGFAGNKSLGQSGYYRLPGGMTIQWGLANDRNDTGGTGLGQISFQVPFGGTAYVVNANIRNEGLGQSQALQINSITNTLFKYVNTTLPNDDIYWMAIGPT